MEHPMHIVRTLTRHDAPTSLMVMRMVRASIVLLLGAALAAYASDCAALTEQQAMQCCRSMSMRCASHQNHGSMGCCKTMSSVRAAIGQPSDVQSAAATHVNFAIVGVSDDTNLLHSSSLAVAVNSHGPPGSFSPPVLSLRI
jgi:hypothetical protein